MTARATPLDPLLADPTAVLDQVSPEQAAALLGRLSSVQALLEERAAMGRAAPPEEQRPAPAAEPVTPSPAWSEADLLTVTEVAALLKTSVRFVYRHAPSWPFTRRLSRKTLRFSRAGLLRYLAKKAL